MQKLSEVKVTPEMLDKIEDCTTAEEVVALAKANNIEVTLEEAKEVLASLERDLSDEELEQVAGGKECGTHSLQCTGEGAQLE